MAMKATWSIVVVYENTETRESAVAFCDYLVEQFWVQSGLEASWWSFESLRETAAARKAADKAKTADWVIFASQPEGDLPLHVGSWIETWLRERGDREGTLVGLFDVSERGRGAANRQVLLREVAHRAGMDYLNQVPQSISQPIPDARESYTERACEVTSVLTEILHQEVPPRLPF